MLKTVFVCIGIVALVAAGLTLAAFLSMILMEKLFILIFFDDEDE